MDDYDRREFVKMSVPAFLAVTFALPSITAFAKDANADKGHKRSDEALNWDAFLEKVTAEAKKQLDPKRWSEPEYVKSLLIGGLLATRKVEIHQRRWSRS